MPGGISRTRWAGRRGIAVIPLALGILLILAAWHYRKPALSSAGTFLDNGEKPRQADAIVVLAGGWRGERILAASELKDKGMAPVVVVSGTLAVYGQQECLLAIEYLRLLGRSTEGFVCADSRADSTAEEAAAVAGFLRKHAFKRILVVSCDTHMRRATLLWRKQAPDLDLTFTPAASPNFDLKRWYATREGRKAVVLEWSKLITSYFGI